MLLIVPLVTLKVVLETEDVVVVTLVRQTAAWLSKLVGTQPELDSAVRHPSPPTQQWPPQQLRSFSTLEVVLTV